MMVEEDEDAAAEVLVLGIGNLLWADEGFGVLALQELERRGAPPGVRLLDGGTQGLYLIPHIRAARRLIVLDAVDFGLAPGTLMTLRGDEVIRRSGGKRLSLHQTTFQDVLAACVLMGDAPQEMLLVGVQAGDLDDFGSGPTPPVLAQIDAALDVVLKQIAEWGF
jgi:hydrogenase maturation protease